MHESLKNKKEISKEKRKNNTIFLHLDEKSLCPQCHFLLQQQLQL